MKKLLLLILLITFFSCNEEDRSNRFYLSFKMKNNVSSNLKIKTFTLDKLENFTYINIETKELASAVINLKFKTDITNEELSALLIKPSEKISKLEIYNVTSEKVNALDKDGNVILDEDGNPLKVSQEKLILKTTLNTINDSEWTFTRNSKYSAIWSYEYKN